MELAGPQVSSSFSCALCFIPCTDAMLVHKIMHNSTLGSVKVGPLAAYRHDARFGNFVF